MADETQNDDAATGGGRLLRILAGPHFGAEMSLRPGRYSIGTDEDCDIVLSDRGLAAHHAFLELTDSSISIQPSDGSVTVDGATVEDKTQLDNFEPVLLGTTVIALGPGDAKWPEIELPKPESEAADAGSDEDGGDSEDDAEEGQDQGDGDQDGDGKSNWQAVNFPGTRAEQSKTQAVGQRPMPTTGAAAAAHGLDKVRGLSGRARLVAISAAAGVVLLIGAGGFAIYAMNSGNQPVQQTAEAPATLDRVKKIVDKLGLSDDLKVSDLTGAGGASFLVEGYVDTEIQRRQLISALEDLRGVVDIRVWSTALLKTSLEQALAGMRLDLTVAKVDKGDVRLNGVLPGSMTEDQLIRELKQDVPGVASIKLAVVSVAAADEWLKEEMAKAGISPNEVTLTEDTSGFVAEGRIDADLSPAWDNVVASFNQHYDGHLSLTNHVVITPASALALNYVVRAVNLGPPAYVTLENNEKLLVGSRLPNGMTLQEIMPNGLVLVDGQTRHLVEIAQDTGRLREVKKLESQ